MGNGGRMPRRFAGVALLAVAVLMLGACGSDKKEETGTTGTTAQQGAGGTTTTTAASAESAKFNDEIQQWLIDVGCYKGKVDGIVGPETDAAIVAFQKAEGLTPDGQVGTKTEAALKKAASEKKTVCGAAGTTTTTSGTTTTTAAGVAPCTATAIQAVLPSGNQVENYVCSGGYAGVEALSAGATNRFILQDQSGTWKNLNQEPCGGASAGISPQVLEVGCNPPG